MADSPLTAMLAGADRAYRLGSTVRKDLGGLLTGPEVSKITDVAPDLADLVAQVNGTLTDDEKAALAWQKALAAAVKIWEASLAELDKLP